MGGGNFIIFLAAEHDFVERVIDTEATMILKAVFYGKYGILV